MSSHLHFHDWADRHEAAADVLVNMKTRLERYAGKPSASAGYTQMLKQEIATLAAYLQSADQTVTEAFRERKAAYGQGFRAGLEKARKDANPGMRRIREEQGNEMARALSIERARTSQPELY